jgi:hypothetical protein
MYPFDKRDFSRLKILSKMGHMMYCYFLREIVQTVMYLIKTHSSQREL